METIRQKPIPQFLLLPFFCFGLLLMGLFSWVMSLLFDRFPALRTLPELVLFIVFLVFIGVAVLFHWRAKGRTFLYLIGYFMNAAGSGLAIGVLFGRDGIIPPPEVLLALLPAAFLCIAYCLMLSIPKKNWLAVFVVIFSILAVALIGFGIYYWICRDPLAGCALVFSGLFFLPFPACIAGTADDPEDKFHYLSYSGFGAFILIAFVVALILSDGDILDGMDFSGWGGSRKKKH